MITAMMKPEKGKSSKYLEYNAGYIQIKYELPYKMTRAQIAEKILKDVEFRENMKEELGERQFRIITEQI